MSFKETPAPREHMRCLLCGKLGPIAPNQTLPRNFHANHELHVLIQLWPSGEKKHISWTGRPMLRDEMTALRDALSTVVERLTTAIEKE